MTPLTEIVPGLVSASPMVLALVVGLAAIGLAAYAIHVVYKAAHGRERRR